MSNIAAILTPVHYPAGTQYPRGRHLLEHYGQVYIHMYLPRISSVIQEHNASIYYRQLYKRCEIMPHDTAQHIDPNLLVIWKTLLHGRVGIGPYDQSHFQKEIYLASRRYSLNLE